MLNFHPLKKKFLPRRVSTRATATCRSALHFIACYKFIRKIAVGFILLLLSLWPLSIIAQFDTPVAATGLLKKEQVNFLQYINSVPIDSNIADRLSRFIGSEADSIHKSVMSDTTLPDTEKAKAIGSLVYFMQELCQNVSLQKFEVYDIPDVLESYKLLLKAFLYHTAYEDALKPFGPRRSQLLAAAFWQYNESGFLKDIAIYKRVVSSPGYVLQFLENYPKFRFADSLLLFEVAYDPIKLVSHLQEDNPGLKKILHNNQNIYLQKIASLSENPNASELLPFIMPLAEKRMSAEDILEKRKNATGYFQLLVNTLKKYMVGQADSSFIFLNPLRNAIKEKAISFYVNQLNELHSSANDVRFASVKGLRIEDIYYIITSCEEELYTSSYLGLYSRLIKHFNTPSVDSLFEVVQYDNFSCFIRMAANYNTLADFLNCMPRETAVALLKRFISGIESDTHSGHEKAMDVADSFDGFNSVPGISMLFRDELKSNLDRCQSGQLYFGIRLYSILLKVFDLVKQKDSVNKLWAILGNPELLEFKSLQNKYGEIIQLVLFYGDKDGIASFNNFMNLFKDPGEWEIFQNELWVTIQSLSDQPIFIYANLPLDKKKDLDLLAQDSLCAFLQHRQAEPVILIHRGHSYHLNQTLKRLQPSVKLTILGSCGGHNNILSVASISPDAQIIVSKKIGSQFINDPMIDAINETLQHKKDLIWTDVWEKLKDRFRKDEFALNLFNEYIPPSKNVSLFVLKLFNFCK